MASTKKEENDKSMYEQNCKFIVAKFCVSQQFFSETFFFFGEPEHMRTQMCDTSNQFFHWVPGCVRRELHLILYTKSVFFSSENRCSSKPWDLHRNETTSACFHFSRLSSVKRMNYFKSEIFHKQKVIFWYFQININMSYLFSCKYDANFMAQRILIAD